MPVMLDDREKLVLVFGVGDISVCTTHGEPPEVVFIREPSENPIGLSTGKYDGLSTADTDVALRMVFRNPQSLEVVVIEMLTRLRGQFDNWEDPKKEAADV